MCAIKIYRYSVQTISITLLYTYLCIVFSDIFNNKIKLKGVKFYNSEFPMTDLQMCLY